MIVLRQTVSVECGHNGSGGGSGCLCTGWFREDTTGHESMFQSMHALPVVCVVTSSNLRFNLN